MFKYHMRQHNFLLLSQRHQCHFCKGIYFGFELQVLFFHLKLKGANIKYIFLNVTQWSGIDVSELITHSETIQLNSIWGSLRGLCSAAPYSDCEAFLRLHLLFSEAKHGWGRFALWKHTTVMRWSSHPQSQSLTY